MKIYRSLSYKLTSTELVDVSVEQRDALPSSSTKGFLLAFLNVFKIY